MELAFQHPRGRGPTALHRYTEEVISLYRNDHTVPKIAAILHEKYDYKVDSATVRRHLKNLGEFRSPRTFCVPKDAENVIYYLWFRVGLVEADIRHILLKRGYVISKSRIVRSRRATGLEHGRTLKSYAAIELGIKGAAQKEPCDIHENSEVQYPSVCLPSSMNIISRYVLGYRGTSWPSNVKISDPRLETVYFAPCGNSILLISLKDDLTYNEHLGNIPLLGPITSGLLMETAVWYPGGSRCMSVLILILNT